MILMGLTLVQLKQREHIYRTEAFGFFYELKQLGFLCEQDENACQSNDEFKKGFHGAALY